MYKAIIGLGNPGHQFFKTRHNIGFRVVDALAERYNGTWQHKKDAQQDYASINIEGQEVLLVKPLTFMNSSGDIVPWLSKKGIKAEDVLIVHDELELPFGKVAFKFGGSAKGHNGLKSFISHWGDGFERLRVGIGRPTERAEVPDFVLTPFAEGETLVNQLIDASIKAIETKKGGT
jgi:PTH1 family peptidyl-tRNA hydrolase